MHFFGRIVAMKHRSSRIFACQFLTFLCLAGCQGNNTLNDSEIVIVHTNDVHCSVDNTIDAKGTSIGYESVAGVRNQMAKRYKNVALADAGDHIQGGSVGAFSRGEDIISIMNEMDFTVSTIGNHEFDYGVTRLDELTKMAEYPYVSCNYVDAKKLQPIYAPYHIEEYETSAGKVKVSFVGITTPETVIKSNPKNFQDENGEFLYSFCQDETGELLYQTVQASIDQSRQDGADYVILLGHVGQKGIIERYRSDVITSHIHSADAFIDGHSHEEYVQQVEDARGKKIVVGQVGSYNKAVGVMKINVKTHTVSDEIVHAADEVDDMTRAKVSEVDAALQKNLGTKVGHSNYRLRAKDNDGKWMVRTGETNLADLASDAFTSYFQSDISLISGGSIRNDIPAGDITYGHVLSVFPFDNDTVVIEATGQQIKDCLEMGAKNYPAYSGAFMHGSNLTYTLDSSVPTSVVTDVNGNFIKVDGEYRVKDIKINGADIDLAKTYTVGGNEYSLCDGGDGLSMFEGCAKIEIGMKDMQLLLTYIQETLGGEIPSRYQNETGEGRLTIL